MQPIHDTHAISVSLSDVAERQVEIAADVAALMEHPGWEHLIAGTRAWQDVITSQLMVMSGAESGASFSDLTGELKGLAKVGPIARGIVQVGEQAKAQAREAEIEEVS